MSPHEDDSSSQRERLASASRGSASSIRHRYRRVGEGIVAPSVSVLGILETDEASKECAGRHSLPISLP